MADLSQLSDEQLQVYREMLSQKQGLQGGGGAPPPPAKPPLPFGLQQGRNLAERITNQPAPQYNSTFAGRITGTEGMPEGVLDFAGGRPFSGAVKTLLPMAAATPFAARASGPLLPSMARAGKDFERVMAQAGPEVLNLGKAGDVALRAKELADAGNFLPKVFRDFLRETTSPGTAPMTYKRGRDFASTASRLSNEERFASVPQMQRQVGGLHGALNEANEAAAQNAGVGDLYRGAMRDYSQAARIRDMAEAGKNAAKSTAGKAAIGAATGTLGGLVGYKAARRFAP